MPEQRSIIDYINDILEAISKAEKFIDLSALSPFLTINIPTVLNREFPGNEYHR